jgi:pilus assembly protein CpaF
MSASVEEAVHARVVAAREADVVLTAHASARALAPLLPEHEHAALVERVLARVHGLGPLEVLLADASVTEVMVNAGRDVWVERAGRLERAGPPLAPGVIEHLIERIVAPLGLRADRTAPIVDARLPDGSRVHAVVAPLAVDGPCLTIRRFAVRPLGLAAFAPPPVVALMRDLVDRRANVLVTGPTSSGKTTFLNALAGCLPVGERVITIEDAAELRLPLDHVVRLEARPPTADGMAGASLRELVRAALRMRPDRLVVGEVRGAEALDMVSALSTGHDGSLATCHANSAADALRRVEAMVLQGGSALPLEAVRELVDAAIDVVVHLARGPGGARCVVEVVEVAPPRASGERTRLLADASGVRGQPSRARANPGLGDQP